MVNITLIGSSHIAKDSVKSIKKEIKSQKPDIVAVELDKNRAKALFNPKPNKLTFNSIKQIGIMGFLFTFFGKILQDKLGKAVGIAPGSDMKTAMLYGSKVDAKIWLIDKDIRIIARDLSTKISFYEKLKIVGSILGGVLISPILALRKKPKKGIDLSKVPPEELITELVSEFRKRFPKLYNVLIEDRNKFMAKRISILSEENPEGKIIVVLGAGHISGIKDILKNKYSIDVQVI